MTTAIFIPTFGRSEKLNHVAEDVCRVTKDAVVYFVVESDDEATVRTCRALELKFPVQTITNNHAKNYAGAINAAYEQTDEPYFFCGADDLHFRSFWLENALKKMKDHVQVVGTNDFLNPYVLQGNHATHYLVDRRYVDEFGGTFDEVPGVVLDEQLTHNFTDTEFIDVAKERGVFEPCLDSHVKHLHYSAGLSANDMTYFKGQVNYGQDKERYESRKAAFLQKRVA